MPLGERITRCGDHVARHGDVSVIRVWKVARVHRLRMTAGDGLLFSLNCPDAVVDHERLRLLTSATHHGVKVRVNVCEI